MVRSILYITDYINIYLRLLGSKPSGCSFKI